MFSFNRVHIIGYQTQPVSIRQTPSGTSVTDLNLVVPYRFRADTGEMLDGKGFHTVTLWGPMADIAGRFIKPGSQLFISGRLQTDSWEDEKTGEKRSKTKIVGLDMIMLDPKDGQLPAPANAPSLTTLINRADVIGNVTRDPEMRTTTGGQQVLTLGVATNERWKDKASNTDRERTEFHNVVIWGALAEEVARTIKKGNRVFVSGRVQTRSWETKDGAKRYTTEVVADTVSFLGTRNPLVDGNIQTEARGSSDANQDAASAPMAASQEPVPSVDVPQIAYASEIKAEDLPF
ncbi:MAG: ssDNA-binding protein [Candidatus Peregrinibacteria bacterium Greene0416_19]|nr:MAG: ssDNA-binding protein [Candidatus Peregrinibacteria bacterium Greene0416_19]